MDENINDFDDESNDELQLGKCKGLKSPINSNPLQSPTQLPLLDKQVVIEKWFEQAKMHHHHCERPGPFWAQLKRSKLMFKETYPMTSWSSLRIRPDVPEAANFFY
ncbi:hypothetical protein ACSBR1_039001 [Camellia fascicularis]